MRATCWRSGGCERAGLSALAGGRAGAALMAGAGTEAGKFPGQGGWLQGLAGDAFVRARLGEAAQIRDMLRVEVVFARAAATAGKVPPEMGEAAAKAILSATLDRDALAERALVDGMPVPGLVAQIRAQADPALHPAIHKGLTSQDVMDTALVLALRDILIVFEARLAGLGDALAALEERFGAEPLMGRTRMQAALPVTVGHRIAGWAAPLAPLAQRLEELRPRLLRLQLGGPVGTRDSLDGHGAAIAAEMGAALNLAVPEAGWHTERGALVELAGWCGAVTGALGKIGADICLMAQQGVDEMRLAAGGASSAMAHKTNPVQAELLGALAREQAGLMAAMQQVLVHEQERSGVAWTLEWLVLPRILEGCGAALGAAARALEGIESMGAPGGGDGL